MNSPFIKLRPTARVSYLGFKAAEGVHAEVHRTNYCYNITVPSVMVGTGAEARESAVISPNQSFKVALGMVSPPKYTLLLSFPLELCNAVQGLPGTIMIEPGDTVELNLSLKALKKIDLAELKFFARMYLID